MDKKINGWEPTRHDYRQLFQKVPCYISVQSPELRIIQTNELFRQDFGDREGELCYNVYKRKRDQCPECPVVKTFLDGQVHSSEEQVITADGMEAFVIVYTSPLKNEKGEIVAVMEMATNITPVKRLQTELTMMGHTVATMAHGIKNILTGLDGGIYVVNSGLSNKDDDEMSKGWDIVQRNVGRIAGLVKDILYCAKKREHEISLIDPNQVVKEIFDLFHEKALLENIELTMDIDPSLGPMNLNADDLHTILSNLVHNALEACKFDLSRREHKVTIKTDKKGPIAIIEVSDNGPGLPEEWKNYLFTEILSTKERYGTGLGLLVTKKIVDELGGQITFSSSPNEGSTFRVSFPIKSPAPASSMSNGYH
ncbi:MAG: ATP-binding protein [Thermodesulfobacteriota bacterium]|nr:ATP-binding protein [Thermodesulfobacteriota bacterium]